LTEAHGLPFAPNPVVTRNDFYPSTHRDPSSPCYPEYMAL
jgi:hypothetical protein